jgi:hypothetical protein
VSCRQGSRHPTPACMAPAGSSDLAGAPPAMHATGASLPGKCKGPGQQHCRLQLCVCSPWAPVCRVSLDKCKGTAGCCHALQLAGSITNDRHEWLLCHVMPAAHCMSALPWGVVIIDESHNMRTTNTRTQDSPHTEASSSALKQQSLSLRQRLCGGSTGWAGWSNAPVEHAHAHAGFVARRPATTTAADMCCGGPARPALHPADWDAVPVAAL